MNFIEATSFFLRVVTFDFINKNNAINLKFRLIPMYHIGSKKYYEQVLKTINECDELLFEGVKGKSYTRFYTNQYKSIADKLGITTQRDFFLQNKPDPSVKTIHADFSEQDSMQEWQKLTLKAKLNLSIIRPIRFYYWYQSGITREKFIHYNMTSQRELFLAYGPIDDKKGTAENFIMNAREMIVKDIVQAKFENENQEDKLVGIMYSAAHMNTFARYLIDMLGSHNKRNFTTA